MDFATKLRVTLNRILFVVCSLILLLMVLDVTWQVFSRYVLNEPASFTDEAARFLMIWLALLGGALLFGEGGHLAVTFFSDKVRGTAGDKVLHLFIYGLIVFFVCFSMIYGGYNLIQRTMLQPSPAMHLRMGYVYLILPLSALFILIYIGLNVRDLLTGKSSRLAAKRKKA